MLEHFKRLVEKAGGGNYQTLINDALLTHVHRRSTLDAVRQVLREELTPYGRARRSSVVVRAGRYSSEDVHRALFPKRAPKPRSIERIKEGMRRYARKRHASR